MTTPCVTLIKRGGLVGMGAVTRAIMIPRLLRTFEAQEGNLSYPRSAQTVTTRLLTYSQELIEAATLQARRRWRRSGADAAEDKTDRNTLQGGICTRQAPNTEMPY